MIVCRFAGALLLAYLSDPVYAFLFILICALFNYDGPGLLHWPPPERSRIGRFRSE